MASFRGLSVFRVSSKGYPGVYWPGHPTANAAGIVYLHRLVAFEAWGDEVLTKHVHHKDEDADNYAIENLELLTNQQHASHHHPGPSDEDRKCATCGATLLVRGGRRQAQEHVFCDDKCAKRHRERAQWPEDEALVVMVGKMGFEAVGRDFGVTGAAVKKRLRVRGLLTAVKLCK